MSNNKLKDWAEIDRLTALPGLEELLLVGNPLYNEFRDNSATQQYRLEVGSRGMFSSGRLQRSACWGGGGGAAGGAPG